MRGTLIKTIGSSLREDLIKGHQSWSHDSPRPGLWSSSSCTEMMRFSGALSMSERGCGQEEALGLRVGGSTGREAGGECARAGCCCDKDVHGLSLGLDWGWSGAAGRFEVARADVWMLVRALVSAVSSSDGVVYWLKSTSWREAARAESSCYGVMTIRVSGSTWSEESVWW
ncbi:uncharacterized protein A4U43_C05F9600 [Asparagus officinalis]|uniref:Uncharacterized protein n=1 Tax=Asparagus officinalis TaxID=4686 RepID=A0A5P1EVX4_ASPOF|nr:uncharacterized protein A4U43_C05F9600 [Asparagus officinalis]